MDYVKKLVVMTVVNAEAAVADAVLASLERSGISDTTVTLREYTVACRVAYAEHRERGLTRGANTVTGSAASGRCC